MLTPKKSYQKLLLAFGLLFGISHTFADDLCDQTDDGGCNLAQTPIFAYAIYSDMGATTTLQATANGSNLSCRGIVPGVTPAPAGGVPAYINSCGNTAPLVTTPAGMQSNWNLMYVLLNSYDDNNLGSYDSTAYYMSLDPANAFIQAELVSSPGSGTNSGEYVDIYWQQEFANPMNYDPNPQDYLYAGNPYGNFVLTCMRQGTIPEPCPLNLRIQQHKVANSFSDSCMSYLNAQGGVSGTPGQGPSTYDQTNTNLGYAYNTYMGSPIQQQFPQWPVPTTVVNQSSCAILNWLASTDFKEISCPDITTDAAGAVLWKHANDALNWTVIADLDTSAHADFNKSVELLDPNAHSASSITPVGSGVNVQTDEFAPSNTSFLKCYYSRGMEEATPIITLSYRGDQYQAAAVSAPLPSISAYNKPLQTGWTVSNGQYGDSTSTSPTNFYTDCDDPTALDCPNASDTFGYLTTALSTDGGNTLKYCHFNSNGLISNNGGCNDVTITSASSGNVTDLNFKGITFLNKYNTATNPANQPVNTYLYAASYDATGQTAPTVLVCAVNQKVGATTPGALSYDGQGCAVASLNYPPSSQPELLMDGSTQVTGLASFQDANNNSYLYLVRRANSVTTVNSISECSISATDPTQLTGCTATYTGNPLSLAIDTLQASSQANSYAYIVTGPNGTVTNYDVQVCSINNGLFTNCASTGFNALASKSSQPQPVAIAVGTQNNAYVADAKGSIWSCALNPADGTFTSCTATAAPKDSQGNTLMPSGIDVSQGFAASITSPNQRVNNNVYVTATGSTNTSLFSCPIKADGSLNTCVAQYGVSGYSGNIVVPQLFNSFD